MESKAEIVSKARRLFIKRERIRRALQRVQPGEKIMLEAEDVDILLTWLKELEKRGVK